MVCMRLSGQHPRRRRSWSMRFSRNFWSCSWSSSRRNFISKTSCAFGSAMKDCEFSRTPKVFMLDKPDAKCGYDGVEQAQRFTIGQRRFFQKPVRHKRSVRIILRLDEMTPVARRIINHGQLSEAMTPRMEPPSKLARYKTGNIGMAVARERNGNFELSQENAKRYGPCPLRLRLVATPAPQSSASRHSRSNGRTL